MGFAKICAPSLKNFPEIWSISAAFVTSTFFNVLNCIIDLVVYHLAIGDWRSIFKKGALLSTCDMTNSEYEQ